MSAFKVNQELLPKRCEICHQADLFDGQRNFCKRCAQVPVASQLKPIAERKRVVRYSKISEISVSLKVLGVFLAIVFGFIFAVWGLMITSCSSHCRSLFHPMHLFIFMPMASLGVFAGLRLAYEFSSKSVAEMLFKVLGRIIFLICTTSIVGAITGFLYQMQDASVYYPPQERAELGAGYGFSFALVLGFTVYSILGLRYLFAEYRKS